MIRLNTIVVLTVALSTIFGVAHSAVTVTAPSNGTCLNVAPGSFTVLNDIVIIEGNKADLPNQTNTTLILTIPSGFEFNPGIGTVTGQIPVASGNIDALSIVVTSTTITITMTVSGINKWDEITISDIEVRALSYGVSGHILRLTGGSGGTATIVGDAGGAGISHGYLEAKVDISIYSIADGNWTNPATWSTGTVPTCVDTVFIFHSVTVNAASDVNVIIIESTGILQANFALTVEEAMHIEDGGTYIHNNTTNASTTIFGGSEYFTAGSNITITAWYNNAIPFPTNVSSDFGNIRFNSTGGWGQKGMFAPDKIKGTLTVSSGTITMDEGNGMTTFLELQDVVVNNTGVLRMAMGTARNLTLITKNYTNVSSSATRSSMLMNCQGNLDWTANGSVYISHNWSGYQHTATNPGNTTITINGDLTIAGGQFNINTNVDAPLTLTVTGNTTITGSPSYVRFIDRNGGDLNFTTTNFYIDGGSSTTLMGGTNPTGDATINVINDLIVTGASTTAYLYSSTASNGSLQLNTGRDLIVNNGTFLLANHSGSIDVTASRNLIINAATGMLRGQVNGSCTSPVTVNVTGYCEVNSGTFRISEGLGNIEIHVVENLNVNNGAFHGIYNLAAANNGSALLNCDNINFNGGTFSLFTSSVNDGKTVEVNCTGNIDINFLNASNVFTFVALAGTNNALLDVNINYHLMVSGNFPGSYFLSSASSGDETIDIGGNMIVNAGDVFIVGNESLLANTHAILINISGDLQVNGGNTRLSTGVGSAIINIDGNVEITNGTLNIKYDSGLATMNIIGNYTQTGGTFNFHSRNATTMDAVIVNLSGDFIMDDGTLNFDNCISATLAEHSLFINGTLFSISGNAIITHANNLSTNWVFGQIYFSNSGTTVYLRNSATNEIRHVKYTISASTIVDATFSTSGFQITSVESNNEAIHNSLDIYGTLDMGDMVLSARQYDDYYSRVTVRDNGRYRTSHTGGLYSGVISTESSINGFINSLNRAGYTLESNSTVEYYGTNTSVITGIPNGYANTNNQKYGNLEVNFTGAAGSTWVYPETTGEVFIRTSLILTEGELNLDDDHVTNTGGRTITVENGATISRTNGFIRSETEDGSGRVIWNITANGSYIIPFGYDASSYIPFTFQQTAGTAGSIEIGTYRSTVDNTPYPPTVTHVRDLSGVDNSGQTVDRFWHIIVPGDPTANLTYSYVPSEGAGIISPRAQLWEPITMGWWPPVVGQTNPTGNTTTAPGLNAFNTWWTLSASSSPLPVELIYFDAVRAVDRVQLKWETASEINSDYFELQKSYNGTTFETFEQVNAAGYSTSNIQYSHFDKIISWQNTYYRLKQVDFDGAYEYSPIKLVKIDSRKAFSVYPTLVNPQSVLQFSIPEDGLYTFQMTDMSGKKVFEHTIQVNSNSKIQIDLFNHNISIGIYLVSITGQSDVYNQKVVVK